MRIHRRHNLGIEEAKRRVDKVAGEIGPKWNLRSYWEGDRLRVQGSGVKGRILVDDESIEVFVQVGMAMMLFREPIRAAIESSIDHYID